MGSTGYVDIEGGRLYYEADGDGPPVVLMHGGLLDHRMWDAQVDALAERYRLIRFDLRGYGRSSPPPGEPYRHCDDLAALLDHFDVDTAVVGGESFGGAVTLDFALAHPDRVRGLVFVAAGPITGWTWQGGSPLKPVFRAARDVGVDAAKEAFLAAPMWDSLADRPDVAAAVRAMVTDYSGWHLRQRDPATFAEPAAIERLEEVTAPALVVIGGRDFVDLRGMGEALAARLPHAHRLLMADHGHVPNMEDPETFNRATLAFLDEVHAASAAR